jgi:hypothetical protein
MAADNKYYETGSNPYHLNLNNTAKDFSLNDSTNPPYGLLDTLTKFMVVEDNMVIQEPIIQEQLIIDTVVIAPE